MWNRIVHRCRSYVNPPVPKLPSAFKRAWMAFKGEGPWSRLAVVQGGLTEDAIGPIQRDEAFLLFGLIRSGRPSCIVEVGFAEGHSARTILAAMGPEDRLYSIDNNQYSKDLHQRYFSNEKRTTFLFTDQREIDKESINGPIDLILFDGSHRLEDNQLCFDRLQPILSTDAVIVVHDTGLWNPELMTDTHKAVMPEIEHRTLQDGVAHQIQERQFVNWLCDQYPHAQILHAHSSKTLRHGLSILKLSGRRLDV